MHADFFNVHTVLKHKKKLVKSKEKGWFSQIFFFNLEKINFFENFSFQQVYRSDLQWCIFVMHLLSVPLRASFGRIMWIWSKLKKILHKIPSATACLRRFSSRQRAALRRINTAIVHFQHSYIWWFLIKEIGQWKPTFWGKMRLLLFWKPPLGLDDLRNLERLHKRDHKWVQSHAIDLKLSQIIY